MSVRIASLLAVAALTAPGAANACRTSASHNYVVLRDPPARLPEGALLFRVHLVGTPAHGGREFGHGMAVRILAGPGAGRTVPIKLVVWSSCSHWFEESETGYVVGWIDGPPDRPLSIEPLQYRARINRTPDEENSVGHKRTELK